MATGGASGMSPIDQTCTSVCNLLATRTTALACVPTPTSACITTCGDKYAALTTANPTCGSDYLDLLTCGATTSADAWACQTVPVVNVSFAVPPHANDTTGCQTAYNAMSTILLANFNTCGAALETN